MIIRVLNESDARIYQKLRLSALENNPEAFGSTYEREATFTLDSVKDRIKPNDNKFILGAFDNNDSLVGIVAFVRESNTKTSHKGNVYGMFVELEMRGQGIGKLLLHELIRKAKSCNDLEQINLTVVSSNEVAKNLYKSLGFEVFGLEQHALKFHGKYYDEELMVYKI